MARSSIEELRPTVVLAGPVVLAELGWVSMGIVDTMVVGRLGPEAIGAVSVGSIVFFTVAIFGMGMLLGLDTLVSQAFGAGRPDECRRTLVQGLYIALALAPPLSALLAFGSGPVLSAAGVQPTIVGLAVPYTRATAWGLGPLLIFAAFRRYLQAIGRLWPILFALVSANLINALANWVLVYGNLGASVWGVEGSGWATTISRVYMATVLVAAALRPWRLATLANGAREVAWRPDPARLRRLLALGLPAAVHVTLEMGVFATATALAGRLDPVALAAHQIVLNLASATFMVPLGLASAAAVLVGRALGRRDPGAAARAGWTAVALGAGFMTVAGLTFLLAPHTLVGAFTDDPAVVSRSLALLVVAACFQLFDGLQAVTTGALRGAGDTRTPMVTNLVAHWVVGLPCGYAMAFPGGLGVVGLWIGLSIGLVVAGLVLVYAWTMKARQLRREFVVLEVDA